EVVAPGARPVAGVVFGSRRVSERVVRPVVERADAGEEAERRGNECGNEDEGLPVEDRMPAAPPTEDDDEPEAERGEAHRHPGGCPAVCAYSGSLSRSGPTVPVAPAALSVWQELQGLFLKTAAPETDVFGDEVAFVWPFSHFAKAAAGITIASLRINECPRPQ